jgi:hypothetical protein
MILIITRLIDLHTHMYDTRTTPAHALTHAPDGRCRQMSGGAAEAEMPQYS